MRVLSKRFLSLYFWKKKSRGGERGGGKFSLKNIGTSKKKQEKKIYSYYKKYRTFPEHFKLVFCTTSKKKIIKKNALVLPFVIGIEML